MGGRAPAPANPERAGKIPAERAVRIALQIHSRGFVHRDLNPDNIMVDEQDRVKLIDFGIAANSGSRRFTKLSQVMGTAQYTSEQVKGKRGGKSPFSRDHPFLTMNGRILNNPVPAREIDPGISPQLQEILYRALERDPKRRYASAREFAWDLQHRDLVGVADRIVFYAMLAPIPAVIFVLLLLVARYT